ncbi:acetyltransferase [Methylocystis echinoides]|uniref:Acetyltransferase n=2 Tax=Methylocystis echinoides TaxID=29468 RepID=A0A9W6GUQ5_9HYPH|nr:acetyltransferase [Methylocystis echinoides]
MTTESCRVDCVGTLDGVAALAAEWAALEGATPEATGFQSFVWCHTWLRLAGARVTPRIVCVREAGRLVLLAPLQIERRFGVAVARWVGEPMTQYGDALAPPGERRGHWRGLAEAEMTRWRDVDLIALTRLRADAVLAEGAVMGDALAAPFVDLARVQQRRRRSVERRARRLETLGPLALVEAQAPQRCEALARHGLALKRLWLREKGFYSAGLSHPVTEDFLAALAREGFLRVHALTVAEEIAALDLGFPGGDAYRSLLGCYDQRFAQGAPGQALTGRLIAHCAAEGLSVYDMLLPADPYKLEWCTGEVRIGARFVPTGFRGRVAAFALARFRPAAKRLIHALAAARRRLANKFSFGTNRGSLMTSREEDAAS